MNPLWSHQEVDKDRYLIAKSLFNTSDPGCVSADTEYLSPTGWKRIDEYVNGEVAQFDPTLREISFVSPITYVKKPCAEFYHINPARGTSQVLSAEHNVLYYTNDGSHHKCSMEEFYRWHNTVSDGYRNKHHRKFETTYSVKSMQSISLSDAEIRVMVMAIADGYFPYKNTTCVVRIKKHRKIQRAHQLLSTAGIPYRTTTYVSDPEFIRFWFMPPRKEKEFSAYWWGCSQQQLKIVAAEADYWDSAVDPRPSKGVRFSSAIKTSADFIQYAFSAAKRPSYLATLTRRRRGREETEYCVQARSTHQLIGPGRPNSIKRIPSIDGYKYCFEVPTGCLLLRHNGYIFATGNTGKTRTIIEVIKTTRIKTLILAPKSILQCAWGNDIEEYAPELTYSVAYATNRAEAFAKDVDIYITNIDAVTWLHKNPKYLTQFEGGFLVVDESTAIKNPTSLRTKAAMAIRPTFAACTCMSGTPTPQGIIDIWAQIFMVDQGQRLGNSFYRFRNNTYTPEKKGAFTTWKEKEGVADAVADLIADITIRNRREDCMDLPPNHVVHRRIALSPTHMRKYQELKKRALVELDSGDVSAVNAAVLLTKLLQLTSGAVYDEFGEPHLVSTDRYELITELISERSQSVVVFNWRHQRDELIKLANAEGFTYGLIDGSVTAARRTENIEQFQAGELKVMYIHPMSASHGITLTKGVATIWASPTYNAEYFEQANARIYRGGQTQTTETILISADGTAEQDVYKALYDKRTNMHNLLEVLR